MRASRCPALPCCPQEEEEGYNAGAAAGLDRPGKRRVRPPARLEDDLTSPNKQALSGTPSKRARLGNGVMSGA